MGSHMIDFRLFRDSFGTEEMRKVFAEDSFVQKLLDAESALARAEAKLNIIPKEAADEISEKAKIKNINYDELEMEIKTAKHPLVPLIRQLESVCANNYGQYIHLGATTQDIIDTATILQVKEAHEIIMLQLEQLQEELMKLAKKHRDTPMPGRTHRQHALPITFGYKTSVWLEEVNRHIDRLDHVKSILFVGQLAGAVGTLASFKKEGFKVQEIFMNELGLSVPDVTWHTSRDNLTEFIFILGMITGTAGKMANEIANLQRTEIQELEEPFKFGKVGSSTMPHKRNPSMCENVVGLSRIVQNNSQLLLNGMIHEHERDKVSWQVEWEVISESCIMTAGALSTLVTVLKGLNVNISNMNKNLMITNGLILSESLMLALGERIGKQKSHDILYHTSMESFEKKIPLQECLLNNQEIKQHLNEDEIMDLLDPVKHTGLSAEITDKVVTKTKKMRQELLKA
ncbi:adenylosuccinate lyase [Pueribacillus theae]|uniref:Adenylosuccinate lyase n=1 Tax=Pueribacillus theae TaxID=2171751 RepID=A0A2U1JRG2_9BACI|nr:adenylosuccinate lyase [Pueribacillus theae]PWA07787.1 adenylosuccinate lyase [Pueribacillus theae]